MLKRSINPCVNGAEVAPYHSSNGPTFSFRIVMYKCIIFSIDVSSVGGCSSKNVFARWASSSILSCLGWYPCHSLRVLTHAKTTKVGGRNLMSLNGCRWPCHWWWHLCSWHSRGNRPHQQSLNSQETPRTPPHRLPGIRACSPKWFVLVHVCLKLREGYPGVKQSRD